MKLNYLRQSPNPNYLPPISSNHQELPISEMPWKEFEKLCLRMVQEIDKFSIQDSQILGRGGQKQEGIDIYAVTKKGNYEVYQCKRYKKLSTSNIDRLIAEFKIGKWFIKSNSFTLCTSVSFDDIKLQNEIEKHRLDLKQRGVNLKIWDSSKINLMLKSHPKLVLDFFGPVWLNAFCGKHVYDKITNSIDINDLKKCFKKASLFIEQTRNYFENVPSTHIIRKEFKTITKWIEEDLVNPNKNLLVIEGVKGIGKSVVIKDIYNFLNNEGYLTLGIKADKYYASTPKELENKIFANEEVTLEKILKLVNSQNIKLVVLIDQIDALSLSLSSNREFLHTYNRLINELLNEKNVRIIISSRSEDLKYDAELSKYKNNDFRNIIVSLLSVEDVKKVLLTFDI
ncbi:ATP-binding protein [Leeuwenhoekiella parthenopeia]|uniref:AAA family ATPase n=1 Tax=Leeuwenhoekiella parthenopeia TaxID=2890320 RepID=A0ABS8GTI3_9FLAO|nr:ATP-binding protein [Leeuwenhoekiella parthenopeia]MCC4212965.1 AAA family ATPase [Leeuwenhoekiella parthenopeia]